MLLLWLFGLGLGVANACQATATVLPTAEAAGSARDLAPLPGAGDHRSQGAVDHAGGSHPHGDDTHHGSVAKTNCQDFCDKAAATLPPLKSALDDLPSQAVFSLAALTVAPLPARVPVLTWVPRPDLAQPPPIAITLQRLAL